MHDERALHVESSMAAKDAVQWVTFTSSGQRGWSGHLHPPQRDLAWTVLLLTTGQEDVTTRVAKVLVGIATTYFTAHP